VGKESDDALTQLREQGTAVLRDLFAKDLLTRLKDRSAQCFSAIATDKALAERYRFNPFSHSVRLSALLDFGYADWGELVEPVVVAGLEPLFSRIMGGEWTWSLEQSWLRKKFAPRQVPSSQYHPQNWHQDGALGARFPLEPGTAIPMTQLLTCWIPLNPCGSDSPGLEFVRAREQALLHYTELDDSTLRQRFRAEDFWAPTLELGDGLVFLNSTLHRTHALPEMRQNRVSVEYRIFPR
jgi:hypothetical protein